jgi:hypothetical protein
MQRAVNTYRGTGVYYVVRIAGQHMFSTGPLRDCISSLVVNQSELSTVKEEEFG